MDLHEIEESSATSSSTVEPALGTSFSASSNCCPLGIQFGLPCINFPVESIDLTSRKQSQLRSRVSTNTDIDPSKLTLACAHHLNLFSAHKTRQCQFVNKLTLVKCKSRSKVWLSPQLYMDLIGRGSSDYVPNSGFCPRCFAMLESSQTPLETLPEPEAKSLDIDFEVESSETPESSLETSFNDLLSATCPDVSPLNLKRGNKAQKSAKVSKKLKFMQDGVREQILDRGIPLPAQFDEKDVLQWKKDSLDYNQLLEELKIKCSISTRAQQVSYLTLAPKSWTLGRTASFFGVSKRAVRDSRNLHNTSGVLAIPQKPSILRMEPEVLELVRNFYLRHDISRELPGMNDVIRVRQPDGSKVVERKRYILANLKEIYAQFKDENPLAKIGIAKFCELRPKQCFCQGVKGFHNVCCCIYHENVKLLFVALGLNYKDYIPLMVCDVKSKSCMFRRCQTCKTYDARCKSSIETVMNDVTSETIKYRYWHSTDGTRMDSKELLKGDFIKEIMSSLSSLLVHDYTAKAQSAFLRQLKGDLGLGEIIVSADFSENYSPVTQDAVQSEYFNNRQVTLHPFVVYYKYPSDGTLKTLCYCAVSDCTKHETNTFYAFLCQLLPMLKEKLFSVGEIEITKVYYFTDGAASQYKNYKNFCNLGFHYRDFGMHAELHFHATAHGKGPSDGVGGTTKRLARAACLQSKANIGDAMELFDFASSNIRNINYFYVSAEYISGVIATNNLEERYLRFGTIKNTRKAHKFVSIQAQPTDPPKIVGYELSTDTEILTYRLIKKAEVKTPTTLEVFQDLQVQETFNVEDWVACVYGKRWYVSQVSQIDLENEELHVSFFKGSGKAADGSSAWVPFGHVLRSIAKTSSIKPGRAVTLDADLIISINESLSRFLAVQSGA